MIAITRKVKAQPSILFSLCGRDPLQATRRIGGAFLSNLGAYGKTIVEGRAES
jgi:hypothetical protein